MRAYLAAFLAGFGLGILAELAWSLWLALHTGGAPASLTTEHRQLLDEEAW